MSTNIIQLKTYLPGFKRNWSGRSWSEVFSMGGLFLSDEQAHVFVDRAIAEGYEYDVDVPDEKVREWLGLDGKGRSDGKEN